MSDVITRPPTLRTVRAAAVTSLGRLPLDVSWYRTPSARLVRVTVRGDLGDALPVGRFLPRPHEHLWVVEDRQSLERFARELRDLVRPALDAHREGSALPTGPRLRRNDPCPWAPCGEHQRPVRFGGVEPDDDSLWAGDALTLTPELLRSLRGPTREQAARLVGMRPDLTTIFADAFGAGERFTVPEFLTLVALAPFERLSLEAHVETCRRLRTWWNDADPDLRAVLVVEGGHTVDLETPLRGLALHASTV